MFFRNLTLFRFPTTLDFSQLDSLLADMPLKPVGALELSSRGFICRSGAIPKSSRIASASPSG